MILEASREGRLAVRAFLDAGERARLRLLRHTGCSIMAREFGSDNRIRAVVLDAYLRLRV